jgi:hypothetical protein
MSGTATGGSGGTATRWSEPSCLYCLLDAPLLLLLLLLCR